MLDKIYFVFIINQMVDHTAPHFDRVFHALASATRRAIIMQVARQELAVQEIAARHAMSLQAVSKHLQILVAAGLVQQTREGRVKRCRMNFEPLDEVQQLLQEYRAFWEGRLDGLEDYFQKKRETEKKKKRKER